jgi:methylated-DNA-[protein]-cysteine S-methyltransferase
MPPRASSKILLRIRIRTSLGEIAADFSDRGIYGVYFPGERRPKFRPSVQEGSAYRNLRLRTIARLRNYSRGIKTSFAGIPLDERGWSFFERKILRRLKEIPWGQTWSYGELARNAGFPGASRAAGTVLRKNRLPIILPCHRVVRSGGRLGRYSQGSSWKRKLLALEGVRFQKRSLVPSVRML